MIYSCYFTTLSFPHSTFTVSPVQSDDIPAIEHLVLKLHESPCMLEDIKRYVEAKRDPISLGGTTISAMVARCAEQVIGVAVLRNEEVYMYMYTVCNKTWRVSSATYSTCMIAACWLFQQILIRCFFLFYIHVTYGYTIYCTCTLYQTDLAGHWIHSFSLQH